MKLNKTNMCLIYNKDQDTYLFQNRIKNDWPGLNLPGGHILDDEDIYDSVIREIKEETNLDIFDPVLIGEYSWFDKDGNMTDHVYLFKTSSYKGILKSNDEGESRFYKLDELNKYKLSLDLDKILKIYGFDIL